MNSFFCTCAAGYSGSLCAANVNECASSPCQNGGTCNDQVNSFFCSCAAGFSGVVCAANINECASNPCQHGGTCADATNAFSCTCASGWTDSTCGTDINECATSTGGCGPCRTCINTAGSFSCTIDCNIVFVSSTTYTGGGLGGTAGADAKCLALAEAATTFNLRGRSWTSWTCGASDPVGGRINHGSGYYLTNGFLFANAYSTMTSGGGANTFSNIGWDENGVDRTSGVTSVWTGCNTSGNTGLTHCLSWSDATSSNTGRVGLDTSGGGGLWTNSGSSTCDNLSRIYCFENAV